MDHDVAGALFDHWSVEPPVEALVAAFVGYKPPSARRSVAEMTDEELRRQDEELMSLFQGGVIR